MQIGPGYSGSGDAAVVSGSDKLAFYRQQQRLSYLGFRGWYEAAVPINGTTTDEFQQAVKLFQAATDRHGVASPGWPATGICSDGTSKPAEKGTVTGIITFADSNWLNAANAPRWLQMHAPRAGNERWATSWTNNVVSRANGEINTLTEYPDRCPTLHTEHKAGLDIDVNVDQDEIVLAMQRRLNEGRPTTPPGGPQQRGYYFEQLAQAERRVVNQIISYVNASGAMLQKILFGNSGDCRIQQLDTHYPWI
jgi:hypothetical protein